MRFRMLLGCIALCLILLASAYAADTPTPAPTKTPVPTGTPDPVLYPHTRDVFDKVENEDQKLIISFIGDVTLGCNEIDHGKTRSIDYYIQSYGYSYPFSRVRYVLSQDDLTVANFEGIVQDNSDGLDKETKKTYNFRAPTDYLNILKDGSIEAVAMGNNHTGDYGEPGFLSSVKALEEYGINWFGASQYQSGTYVFEKNGVKIGFVSSYISFYWQNVELLKSQFEDLKAQGCSPIIAVIHGGVEYSTKHDNNQTNMAKKFISWGADIVIGHHPHCLQGYEIIDDVPVFYSLGNFMFGGNFNMKTKYTVILQFALSFDSEGNYIGYQVNLLPCRLSSSESNNLYQPYLLNGRQAELCIQAIQYDTKKYARISNYQEGIGALQPFVSVVKPEETVTPAPENTPETQQ